jgi:SAM-dependent methyltransferase
VQAHGEDHFLVRSPALLGLVADWVRIGVPPEEALDVVEVLAEDLGALARKLADLIVDRVWEPVAATSRAGELPDLLRRARPPLLQGAASTLIDRLGLPLAERAETSSDGGLLRAALEKVRVGGWVGGCGRGLGGYDPPARRRQMSIANTAQAEHWNSGEGVAHWVRNQARYDRMHAPFTALLLDAAGLRPDANVLDVGCGCGGTTLAAARLIAPGQAVGLDLSGPMLARARADADAAGLGNVLFLQGDAQVHQLEPARFDVAMSRFGVMFFADPVAAFANIRSATRLGGRLVFVCWQALTANQWLRLPGAALAEHVPPVAGFGAGDGPGMFSFADPDRVREILAAAGWQHVEITAEQAPILVGGGGSVDDAVEFLRTATMGRTMLARADPGTAGRAIAAVRDALGPYADADGVRLGAAVWLVQAAAP